MVPYYGTDTPLSSVANVTVKDSRTLQVVAFERNMLAAVDKAIQSAGLNLNPTNLGAAADPDAGPHRGNAQRLHQASP